MSEPTKSHTPKQVKKISLHKSDASNEKGSSSQQRSHRPRIHRRSTRNDRSIDISTNNSLISESPLKHAKENIPDSYNTDSRAKKKIAELKSSINGVENFIRLNHAGIILAVAMIVLSVGVIVFCLVAPGLFQTAGCSSSYLSIPTSANTEEDEASSTDSTDSVSTAAETLSAYSTSSCDTMLYTIKGLLIGGGVMVLVLEMTVIVGHCMGISAFKQLDVGKMTCAHTFYVCFVILGICSGNVCWCIIYFKLMRKAEQIRDMLRDIELLQARIQA